MTALALGSADARRPAAPGWLRTVGAVIYGTLSSFALSFLWLLPVVELADIPLWQSGEPTGHGWPWRIEGPWSFAADLGPLLLMGYTFAFGVDALLSKWTGVRATLTPLALTAVIVGWVGANGPDRGGLVPVETGLAFVAVVLVARHFAVHERRPRRPWTVARVVAAGTIALVLGATWVSYGLLHPLTASGGDTPAESVGGRVEFNVSLRNEGSRDARLLSFSVPGETVISAPRSIRQAPPPTVEELYRPLEGQVIAARGWLTVDLALPQSACGATIDRFDVRLRVPGREVEQVVRPGRPIQLLCG